MPLLWRTDARRNRGGAGRYRAHGGARLGEGADAPSGVTGTVSTARRPPPPAMTPERWTRLEPLVDAALDLASEQRRAYVDLITTSEPTLGADLERLLHHYDRDDSL